MLLFVGVGATTALYPFGEFSAVGRCALSVVAGYAVMAVVAFILAAAHALTSSAFAVFLGVVGVALWVAAFWRNRSRATLRPLVEHIKDEPIPLLTGAAVVIAIGWMRVSYSPLQNIWATTAFRYWADGVEMASAGRVPAATLQWGALYAPTVSKVMLNSFDAGMIFVLRSPTFASMGALTWISATGLSLSLWWLGVELGLRRTAPLLILLLCANTFIGNHELTSDLKFFRAETFGRMVAFSALALAIRGVRNRRGYLDLAVAGCLFGVSLATHLVPSAISLGMLVWYCLFVALRERTFLIVAKSFTLTVAIALAIMAGIFVFSGGDLAFGGSSGGGSYQPVGGADPTALFTTGAHRPLRSSAGHWYKPPRDVLKGYVRALLKGYVPDSVKRTDPYLILVVLLLIGIGVIWFSPMTLKPTAAVAVGCAVNIIVITLAFDYLYDVYILATFGARRLADYAVFPILILLLVILEWLASMARVPRIVGDGVIGAVVVSVAVALLLSLTPGGPHGRATNATLEYLDWIRSNTPCNARILSNRRTGGTYEALTGRAGVLEGMGPHLRPPMLDTIVRLLRQTRRFFEHPEQGEGFLRREGINYVVVYRHKPLELNLRAFIANVDGFSTVPFMRPAFQNHQVTIYEVKRFQDQAPLPLATDHPGYECDRSPIETAGIQP